MMRNRTISLSEEEWARIDHISQTTGHNIAQVTRDCVGLGLIEKECQLQKMQAYQNSLLVGKKLRQRLGKMEKAISDLAEIVGDDAAAASKLQELKGYLKD